MTDWSDEPCAVSDEYERLVQSGMHDDARRLLAEKLRDGYQSGRFRNHVADIIDPDKKRSRGRPRGSHLAGLWHAIGRGFDDLTRTGGGAGSAYTALASEYGVGERTIQRIVKSYKDDLRDDAQAIDQWKREFASWSDAEKEEFYAEVERQYQSIGDGVLYVDSI